MSIINPNALNAPLTTTVSFAEDYRDAIVPMADKCFPACVPVGKCGFDPVKLKDAPGNPAPMVLESYQL